VGTNFYKVQQRLKEVMLVLQLQKLVQEDKEVIEKLRNRE